MSTQDRRNLIVDNPIINDPFGEPTRYWLYTEGQPQLKPGRRPSGYYLAARTTTKIKPLAEEEFVEIEHVNQIRERIRQWREQGFPGTTRITRELLDHWNDPEREGIKIAVEQIQKLRKINGIHGVCLNVGDREEMAPWNCAQNTHPLTLP